MTRHTRREWHASLHILVAEDNPVNQVLILRFLKKQGHFPELAQDGQQAIRMADTGEFDVVLMDVQMPGMDGLEATATIRAREKERGTHLPIFAMTAYAMKYDEERCLAAGMDGYISKPVSLRAIQRVLDGITPAQRNSERRWDRAEALSRAGDDENLLHDMVEIFLREYPSLVSSLRQALAECNAEMLSRSAHRLKGEVGYFTRGPALSAVARIEDLARQADFTSAVGAIAELEAALASLEVELEEFCRKPNLA